MLKHYVKINIFLLLVLLNSKISFTIDIVTLYDQQYRVGESLTLEVKGCKNVPPEWNDKASSIEVKARCIQLYQNGDCTGRMVTISPENRLWLNNLKKFGFNDALSSVGTCQPPTPKLKSGRYAIRNPWDSINYHGVLTVHRLNGGRTTVIKQEQYRKDLAQKWEVEKQEYSTSTFWFTPGIYQSNPLSYDNDVERINWIVEGLPNQLFILRKQGSNQCLSLTDNMETVMVDCRNEDKAQQWTFIKIFGTAEYD